MQYHGLLVTNTYTQIKIIPLLLFQKNVLKSYASFSPSAAVFRFCVGAFAAGLRALGGIVVRDALALDFWIDDGLMADG